jgi:hypothetical protein
MILADALTLAGKDRLVHGEAVALDGNKTAVGGDAVTDGNRDDVTGHELVGLDAGDMAAIADDIGLVGRVFLEGGNGLLGATLLRDSDNGIENEDRENLGSLLVYALERVCGHVGRAHELRTTAGSTKALQPPSSSKKASTKETTADPRSIITSWSLNCSRMSSQMGVGGSSGMAAHASS